MLKSEKVVFWSVFFVLIFFAWFNRFIQDDAFISFRYAFNWLHGNGLVWNPGERVEGYTNFFWTLLIGIGMKFGIEPVTCSYLLGLLCFGSTLILMCRLSIIVFHSHWMGLLSLFLLGTNYTFSSYVTGGMETQLQTCLFVASAYLVIKSIDKQSFNRPRLFGISFLLGMAVLTRLDSVLCCIVLFTGVLYFILKGNSSLAQKIVKSTILITPFFILVGGWFVWKWFYYGHLLPNTYYAKVASVASLKRGGYYIYLFLLSYGLFPFLLFFPVFLKKIWKHRNAGLIILVSIPLLWMIYVIRVGGDFMEFRFIVPILPFIVLLLIWLIRGCIQQREVQWIFFLWIFLASLHHQFRFGRYIETGGIEPIKLLERHLMDEDESWIQIGRVLGKAFQAHPDVKIATTACGAIPYYSHLKTLDMLGLNDPWIARHGQILNVKTGHRKMATFSYLIENNVHLVIGHPFMKSIHDTTKTVWFGMLYKDIKDKRLIPENSQFLEIPINESYKLVVYYLTQNPIVDRAIHENHWTAYPVFHEQKPSS